LRITRRPRADCNKLGRSTKKKLRILLSALAPEALGAGLVGGEDPLVVGSGPEPAVDVDGLKVGGVAALALEVTLPAGGVDGADVV
jgi:hypothetical protein